MQIYPLSNDWVCPSSFPHSFWFYWIHFSYLQIQHTLPSTLLMDDFAASFTEKIEIIKRAQLDKPPPYLILHSLFLSLNITLWRNYCFFALLCLYSTDKGKMSLLLLKTSVSTCDLDAFLCRVFKSAVSPIFPLSLLSGVSRTFFCERLDSIFSLCGPYGICHCFSMKIYFKK